ncbi:sulfatase family protein [Niabella drilacis]|uniref:Arylsulfatase A n=1 Tax=Niabella drilacis (strain DSM 25811 / CCM 8410 / CCUG 62505 / LMG 26954 / E90) TaxID=1285928 RepID=A0A1G6WIQ5_NIADE|nr:arylsulfatase [Niabella drilacis]SDD65649.1 Arylsulfatase A [Niabella drilacis]
MKPFFNYLFILAICLKTAATAAQAPNIVFILADDLGYGDIRANNENGKINTPNIDRIARAGIRFTDAHTSSSVCTPSRYGILTGRYNWRSSLKQGVLGTYGRPLITDNRSTLATMLKKQGYQTACIGKWHLGFNWKTTDGKPPVDAPGKNNLDYTARISGGPVDLGFDYYFGVDAPNYPPYAFIENDRLVGHPDRFLTFEKPLDSRPGAGLSNWNQEEIMPRLQQKTEEYILQASKNRQPFFLYLPLTGPHTPVLPSAAFKGKSGLNIYADFVMQADAYVGTVLRSLQKAGIADNTILVFASDNGCSPGANFEELEAKGHFPSYILRGAKADIYEGGHRVPCLIQWPRRIKGDREVKQPISLVDFFASFAHITGYPIKDHEAEDSYNLYPLLANPGFSGSIRSDVVMHSIDGSFSIRKNNWKLELCPGSGGWSAPRSNANTEGLPPVQLYNLSNDIEEKNNVQAQHPRVVKKLTDLLIGYIEKGRSTPGKPQKNNGTFIPKRVFFLPGMEKSE